MPRSLLHMLLGRRKQRSTPAAMIQITDDRCPASPWLHSAIDDDGDLIWPDDPNEVPAWRIEREAWAFRAGVKLPPYRTRRDVEQQEDLAIISTAPLLPPEQPRIVSIDDMARMFLAYLVSDDMAGEYSALEISSAYAEFCSIGNIKPCQLDPVKSAMSLLPGVHRIQTCQRVNGKRQRAIRWIIAPADIAPGHPRRDSGIVEFRQAA